MSEIPGPTPDELGLTPEGENSEASGQKETEQIGSGVEQQLSEADKNHILETLKGVGIDLVNPENNEFPGFLRADKLLGAGIDLISLQMLFKDLEAEGQHYSTIQGTDIGKLLAREQILDRFSKIRVTRVGTNFYSPGILVTDSEKIMKVMSIKMEHDLGYRADGTHLKKKTLPVFTCVDSEGVVEEWREVYPSPLYRHPDMIDKVPEHFAYEVGVEYEDDVWRLGDRFRLRSEPTFFGRVAVIPDQQKYPAMVVGEARDYKNDERHFYIPVEEIEKVD